MLEPVTGGLKAFDVVDQRADRGIDPDAPRAWQRLDRQFEYNDTIACRQLSLGSLRRDNGDENAVIAGDFEQRRAGMPSQFPDEGVELRIARSLDQHAVCAL